MITSFSKCISEKGRVLANQKRICTFLSIIFLIGCYLALAEEAYLIAISCLIVGFAIMYLSENLYKEEIKLQINPVAIREYQVGFPPSEWLNIHGIHAIEKAKEFSHWQFKCYILSVVIFIFLKDIFLK